MTDSPAEKLDFKKILPIFVIVLVDLLGLTIILPLLPVYAASFGADPVNIGVLLAVYPVMQLIGGPVLGAFSDRLGRKPVLVVSQIGTLIGFIVLALAHSLPLLLLSRVIDGISGGNIATAEAAIADSTNEHTRTQGLGLIGAAFGIGFILGPLIASFSLAVSHNNYQIPALIAAGFSLASVLLTAFWFHETLPAEQRGKHEGRSGNLVSNMIRVLRLPQIGILMMLVFMQQLVFGGYESLLVLFNLSRVGLDAAGNGVVFAVAGVILVLVQAKFIGGWSRRFGERRLIYAGLALLTVGLMLTAVTPEVPVPWYSRAQVLESPSTGDTQVDAAVPLPDEANAGWLGLIWLLAALVPTAIGASVLSPSINSLITQRSPETETGSMLGMSASLMSLANGITPIIGGVLFQVLGTSAPFLVGAAMMAVILWVALRSIHDVPKVATESVPV